MPEKREYLKRGPAPKTGLLDIPGVREAIANYLKPEAFLRRGFYPVLEPKSPTPTEKITPEKVGRSMREGVATPLPFPDQPTLAITRGLLNRGIDKYLKGRMAVWEDFGLQRGASREEARLIAENLVGKEQYPLRWSAKHTPEKLVESLGAFRPVAKPTPWAGRYIRELPKSKKSLIQMSTFAGREPGQTYAHEMFGHHLFDTYFRKGPEHLKVRELAKAFDQMRLMSDNPRLFARFMLSGTDASEKLPTPLLKKLRRASHFLEHTDPEEAFAYIMERAGGWRGHKMPQPHTRFLKKATSVAKKALQNYPSKMRIATQDLIDVAEYLRKEKMDYVLDAFKQAVVGRK